MANQVVIELLASRLDRESLRNKAAVVVDILRATTTITQALASGAERVIPCQSIDQARDIAGRSNDGPVLLGGERGGKRIEGFDLGNSPAEYTAKGVSGTTIVFTTTNGTAAMARCTHARSILMGSFLNRAALADQLSGTGDVAIVCAGTNGEITREDVLFAGSLADRLIERDSACALANDQAAIAVDAWRHVAAHSSQPEWLEKALRDSLGGYNLRQIGLDDDIAWAARTDRVSLVPVLNTRSGEIVPLAPHDNPR